MSTYPISTRQDASFTNLTVKQHITTQNFAANNVTVENVTVQNRLETNVLEVNTLEANNFVANNISVNTLEAKNAQLANIDIGPGSNGLEINGPLVVNGPVTIAVPNTLNLTSITKNGTTLQWPNSDGPPGSFVVTDGTGQLGFVVPPGGTGNVNAATPFSFNNSLIRANLAVSSTDVKDSTVLLSDANDLSGLNSVTSNVVNAPTLNGTATSALGFTGALSGDVTGTQAATIVSFVGGQSAANVASATILANASTSAPTANAIVRRDGAGNFSASTITANLNGNATTATTAGSAGSATTAVNFTGPLAGDVSGTQGATKVDMVGTKTATDVSTAVGLVETATSAANPNMLVKRDGTGAIAFTTATGNLNGNATTATTAGSAGSATTAVNFTGSLAGDVTGTQAATVVANVGGQSAANVATATLAANAATDTLTNDTIIKRNAITGGFSAGPVTSSQFNGPLNGNATSATTAVTAGTTTNFTGPLTGDVTGSQSTTKVDFVGGATAANIALASGAVQSATSANTGSALVRRDGTGNFAGSIITGTQFMGPLTGNVTGNASTATTAVTSTNFSGALAGDVTGTQAATVVAAVGGKTAAEISTTVTTVAAATTANTVGTLIQRDGITSGFASGPIAVTGNLTVSAGAITSPQVIISGVVTNPTDAATKNYVDTVLATGALAPKPSVNALADSNIVLAGLQTIDGVALIAGNRVLVTAQTDPVENGIWVVAAGAWTRPADFNTGDVAGSAYVLVQRPTGMDNVYGGSSWLCATPTAVIGTDPIQFNQFAVADNVNAANIGASGVGIFATKISNTLNFKKVNSTDPHLTIVDNANTTVDFSTNTTSTNTANTIVGRDASGNFTAGTITANLTGTASENVKKSGDSISGPLYMSTQNPVRFENAAADGKYVGIRGPTALTGAAYTVNLPPTIPTAGQVLRSSLASATALEWATIGGGSPSVAPTYIYVYKNGSDLFGDGSFVSPFATVQQALTIANAISTFAMPVVIALGPGRFTENNSGGALQVSAAGITICGSSVTGTTLIPSTLNQNLLQVNVPFFESCSMTYDSGSSGGSTAAGIVMTFNSPGNVGIHTVLVTRFQTGLAMSSTSVTGAPTVILAQFQAIGNGTPYSSSNIRLINEDGLFLGPVSGVVPTNSAPVITGADSNVLMMTCSLRSFANPCTVSNLAQVRSSACTFENNTTSLAAATGGGMTVVGANFIGSPSGGSVGALVSGASSILEITGSSFNGQSGLGSAVKCIDQGTLTMGSCTIKNYGTAIESGAPGDTIATSTKCQSVTVQNCTNDAIHNGSSLFYFLGGLIDPSKITVDVPTNVQISAFDDMSTGTLVTGNTQDISQALLRILNAEASPSLPSLNYSVALYNANGLVYSNPNATDSIFAVDSQLGNANSYALTRDRTKNSTLRLLSDTAGTIGAETSVRGWKLQKTGAAAMLDIKYLNSDTSGQPAVGEYAAMSFDGVTNSIIFPEATIAPLPTNVYSKLYWGPLVDNTNLYRLSAGVLQTDGNLVIGGLSPSFVVTTNGAKQLTSSSVTNTELSYLSGVTSSIQTQLNGKVSKTGDTMSGPLVLPLGSSSTPSLTFVGLTATTGLSATALGNLRLDTGGTSSLIVDPVGQVTIPALNSTGVVHNSAGGVLSTSLIVGADIASNTIPDSKLQQLTTAGKVANSATSAVSSNTASTIVSRDGSGNFAAGVITASLNGNAATATTAASSGSFSGALAGDVTGTQGATVVATVGGQTAANVASATVLANAATNLNTASTIVRRDASGNFTAGTITAALSGNATTSTTSTNFTGSLAGNVTGTQGATVVATVGGQTAANVAAATLLANAATNLNTASTIVRRDGSGNFAAGTITAALSGNATTATTATNWTGLLSGDVTGTQAATVVATVGGQTAANVASATVLANAATNLNTASTIVRRDGSGNFTAGTITAALSGNATTATSATTATNFSGSLAGNVTGTQGATVVASVGGQTAANVASATVDTLAATSTNTLGAIVKRLGTTGGFDSGPITITSNNNATSFTVNGGTIPTSNPVSVFNGGNTGISGPSVIINGSTASDNTALRVTGSTIGALPTVLVQGRQGTSTGPAIQVSGGSLNFGRVTASTASTTVTTATSVNINGASGSVTVNYSNNLAAANYTAACTVNNTSVDFDSIIILGQGNYSKVTNPAGGTGQASPTVVLLSKAAGSFQFCIFNALPSLSTAIAGPWSYTVPFIVA